MLYTRYLNTNKILNLKHNSTIEYHFQGLVTKKKRLSE